MTTTPARTTEQQRHDEQHIHVERFRLLVRDHLGLDFDETRLEWLAGVLRDRAQAAHQTVARYLEHDRLTTDEIKALGRQLTVTETFFFRSPDQLKAFADFALKSPTLRILSAGSASGEEAYSLAMLLREVDGAKRPVHLSIKGIDINSAMLDRARAAVYSSWSLRETPHETRERWFRLDSGGKFALDRSIRGMVTFEEKNLATDDPSFWQASTHDVVFCRNVLMYFAPAVARAIVARFARMLRPGGLLFLGHAENLRGLSHDFHLHHTHNTFYYERRDTRVGAAGSSRRPPQNAIDQAEEQFALEALVTSSRASSTDWVETIRKATERIHMLGDSLTKHTAAAVATPPSSSSLSAFDLTKAAHLLAREEFAEAREMIDALPHDERRRNADVLLIRAVLLTHAGGDLVEAAKACDELLELDEMSAGAHYVVALCREVEGDLTLAATHDRLAIHLDSNFAMPRLHLGRLVRRQGDRMEARLHFEHALALLEREDAFRLLLFGGGFKREALMALCRAELTAVSSS